MFLDWEKIDFSLVVSRISPEDRILAVIKIKNDGENLWKLYGMLNRPLRIYIDNQIAP